MAYDLRLEANRLGVIITFTGLIKGDEIFKLNEKLMLEETFPDWCYQIWDFSNADNLEVTLDQMRSFALQDAKAAEKSPNQRIAIVHKEEQSNGQDKLFHIFEKVWGGYESKSFFDVDSAREWGIQVREQTVTEI